MCQHASKPTFNAAITVHNSLCPMHDLCSYDACCRVLPQTCTSGSEMTLEALEVPGTCSATLCKSVEEHFDRHSLACGDSEYQKVLMLACFIVDQRLKKYSTLMCHHDAWIVLYNPHLNDQSHLLISSAQ